VWQCGCDKMLVDRDTLIGGAAFPGVLPTKRILDALRARFNG
jgi:hypothetical protein